MKSRILIAVFGAASFGLSLGLHRYILAVCCGASVCFLLYLISKDLSNGYQKKPLVISVEQLEDMAKNIKYCPELKRKVLDILA